MRDIDCHWRKMNTSNITLSEESQRVNKVIRVPFSEQEYEKIVSDPAKFRQHLDQVIKECPELFPCDIAKGYHMQQSNVSKKLNIRIRQIKVGQQYYTVHPSFVMPYLSGTVEQVEKALFLRKFNVPFWALS